MIMPIAVDICNTLADINGQLVKKIPGYCNSTYPFPIPDGYFTSPDGLRVFSDAEPFLGTEKLLSSLAELFGGLVYVTTRPPEAEFVTRRWLAKHGYPESKIVFCKWEEKTAVYSSLAPHLIIEDDPRVLETVKALNTLVMVPQWPYNSHIKGRRIVPANWTTGLSQKERAVVQWR